MWIKCTECNRKMLSVSAFIEAGKPVTLICPQCGIEVQIFDWLGGE